jgi:hypothetical protein
MLEMRRGISVLYDPTRAKALLPAARRSIG